MKHLSSLALISIILFTTSCYNCSGVNARYHTYAYKLNFSTSSIKQDSLQVDIDNSTINRTLQFFLNPQIREEKGDRKCLNKDLVIGTGEKIEKNNVKLYCDKDLYFKDITITKGANIIELDTPVIVNFNEFVQNTIPIVRLPETVTSQFSTGIYGFYLEGTTSYGNTFKDSIYIIFN